MAATNEAKIRFTAETHEFNNAINAATSQLKALRAQLQLNATQMKEGGDQTQRLKERYDELFDAFAEAGKQVEALREKVRVAKEIFGENSNEVANLTAKLAAAENTQEKYRQELKACVEDMHRLTNETNDSQSAYAEVSTRIREQEGLLEKLKQAYVEAALKFGENSDEAKELGARIDDLSADLKENKDALESAQTSADSFDNTLGETKSATEVAGEAVQHFKELVEDFDNIVGNLVKRGFRELINGLVEIGKAVYQSGSETEQGYATVQAVMQASDSDMAMLKQRALEVQQGVSGLPYTLKDAADAYYYMGLAGWDAEKSAAALYPVLSLVTASGEDLSRVSDIVTDNVTAFRLTADDTSRVCDVLAQTMRSSNTTVDMLGETFKFAATPAAAAGYNIEDVSLAAGLMANNGIKAGQAGTVLRTMFASLAAPTKKALALMEEYGISLTDSSGNMYSLKQLMDQTRVAFAGMSVDVYDAEGNLREYDDILAELEASEDGLNRATMLRIAAEIYGKRAMTGVLSIVNMTEEEYKRVTQEVYNYDGACQEMASTMNDTLQGDLKMLNTSLDNLANQIYDNVSPSLRQFVQTLTNWVQSDESVALIDQIASELTSLLQDVLQNLPNIIQTISGHLRQVPNIISGISNVISFLVEHIDQIVTGIKLVLAAWLLVQAQKVGTVIGQVIASVVSLVSGLIGLTGATNATAVAQGALNIAMNANPIGAVIAGVAALTVGIIKLVGWIRSWFDNTEACNQRISAITSSITPFNAALSNMSATIADVNSLTNVMGHTVSSVESEISDAESAITAVIKQAIDENRALREEEIASIHQYNEKIRQLEMEKLAIYRQNQQTEYSAILAEGENMTRASMQQHMVNLTQTLSEANDATEAAYTAQLSQLQAQYEAEGKVNSEEHLAAIRELQAWRAQELATNQASYNESLALMTGFAANVISGNADMWNTIYANSNAGREQFTSNMEQMDAEATNAFLSMWAEARKAGVEIPAETDQMAMSILGSFESMPKNLEEQGKNMLTGLISGMDSTIPALQDTTEMSCAEIVGTIKDELDIHSPSLVLFLLGQQAIQGIINGIKDKQTALNGAAIDITDALIKDLTPDAATMTNIGANAIAEEQRGLDSKKAGLDATATNISKSMVSSLTPSSAEVTNVGANVISGVESGMSSKTGWLGSRISQIARGAVNSFKAAFQIGSPSKVMAEEVGQWIPAGIGEGIEDNAGAAIAPVREILDGITGQREGLASSLGGMSMDVSSRIEDHMSDALTDHSQLSMLERILDAVEDLADRQIVVNTNVNGTRFMRAVASAGDSVNGDRISLRERGLALE